MFGLRQTVLIWQINDVDSLKLVSLHCAGLFFMAICQVLQCQSLLEKCPNTELFLSIFSCILVCIFLYSDWIQRFTSEYMKIRTRNNSVFGHVSCSVIFMQCLLYLQAWNLSELCHYYGSSYQSNLNLFLKKKEDLHLPNQKRIKKSCKPFQSTNFMNCSNKEKLNDRYSNIIASGW